MAQRGGRALAIIVGMVTALIFAACGLSIVSGEAPDGGSGSGTEGGAQPIGSDGSSPPLPGEDGAPPSKNDAGDLDSGPGVDAQVDSGFSPQITFIQEAHALKAQMQTLKFGVTLTQPTKSGSFLAVVSTYAPTMPMVTAISDNAPGGTNTYAFANNSRSFAPNCQGSEIWYARNVKAGATTVTVTTNVNSLDMELWVIELSGLATAGLADHVVTDGGGPANTITAPTTTPGNAPALIVAAVGSCGLIGPIVSSNPFTALPIQLGNGAAYYIAPTVKGWGPVYSNNGTSWNASTAAFR